MRIEVVYARAAVQDIVVLELPEGALVRHALALSGMLTRHGLAPAPLQLGIGGRKVAPQSPLHEGDRVEILRLLTLDPKEARRRRARKTRV